MARLEAGEGDAPALAGGSADGPARRCLASVELAGGELAFRTELIDVGVEPGVELWLVVTDERTAPSPAEAPVIVWGEPALIGSRGELSLLELSRESEAVGDAPAPAPVATHRSPAKRELFLGGRLIDNALLMPGPGACRVRVPAGHERLVVECGFDGSALPADPVVRFRCSVFSGETPAPAAGVAGAR